ncbi:TlyA family RNA methyltransferase [Dietzia psychralcaliphila]|uniref:16S/23S rRNA (Cytidine-2'-O)-methyltransferase n=1 Tax=Dietzia psychralcaliphila TaxID=139021 RepID=A0AAD0JQK9_9ACTN|nr:TlyA family RNA methyltransferase [Dietzia psychralcaliphila]AWH95304.1 16S/23S rRNA (cytidine-2'-O)-methyltransferase [Dietzia psychralcaliphila]PTM85534.1 23S rRNA (cytidine1920-2'-O)/16S rRNA (cytidine1409-2'-O)-methyltransferase [Dietzia psychralcaliphila]
MAPTRRRLDAELVRRKMCDSRERAQDLIGSGRVIVNGVAASKPATQVEPTTSIALAASNEPDWASRGAHKLIGALDSFGVGVAGARCLDAGASTGGFTDVLLTRGADRVEAVDVGYGQLVWRLRNDDRVGVHDKTNVRSITPEDIGGEVDVVVSDLSFISLPLVLPALTACVRTGGDLLPMVKPQFEVGRERVGQGGVVRDTALRIEAVTGVARAAAALGVESLGCVASPLPGPSGNVEYFLHLRKTESGVPVELTHQAQDTIHRAVEEGPK